METKKEFETIGLLVQKLLSEDERCRNDDKWLTVMVFNEISLQNGKKMVFPIELFDKFPAFETVKRLRAIIQNNKGLFLPTDPKVVNKRKQRQKDVMFFVGEATKLIK